MATDLNKPLGISHLIQNDIKNIMHKLPINKFYGIGKATIPKLIENNINTIGDLAKKHVNDLFYIFKNRTQTIINNANGIGDENISTNPRYIKTISKAKTFLYEYTNNREELISTIKILLNEITNKLRDMNCMISSIGLKLTYENNKNNFQNMTISNPTFSNITIFNYVMNIFDNI